MPLNLDCGETDWGTWSAAPGIHIHFWIKRTAEPSTLHTLLEKLHSTCPYKNGWKLHLMPPIDLLVFDVWTDDATNLQTVGTWEPTLNQWYCMDVTFDGRYARLYIDNVLKNTGDIGTAGHELAVGATDILLSATDNYPAHIEGLAIWNEPLSAADQTLLFHAGRRIALAEVRLLPSPAGTLEAMLELTDDSLDYSGNGRDLALTASLTYDCGQPFTRRLGGEGGAYWAPYCPPLMPAHEAQRRCSHTALAETTGR